MHSLDDLRLESNNQIKINFNEDNLSSDAGMIHLKLVFNYYLKEMINLNTYRPVFT